MQKVYVLDINDVSQNIERIVAVLDENAVLKAESYAEVADKIRSLGGAFLVKAFTAAGEISYNAYGKPYKRNPPFFNVSHSGNTAAIFVNDDAEVGLDIQKIKEFDGKLINYVFSKEEKKGVYSDKDFAVRWTMKEAAVKCVGTGLLSVKRRTFSELDEKSFVYCGKKLYYQSNILGDYALTACSYEKVNAEILRVDCDFIFKTLAKNAENII